MATKRREEIDAATMPASLNGNVATDLHPHSLLPHADILVDGESTDVAAASYDTARRTLKVLYESADAIDQAHTACMTNIRVGTEKASGKPILQRGIDPQRAPQLAAAMSESFGRAAAQIEASDGILGKTVEKLENDVATSLVNKRANETSVSQAAGEIRQYLRSNFKDPGARLNFLMQCIEQGDHETISAVLATRPWVSGLDREQQARVRDLAAEKFAQRSYKQLKAITAVRAHLDRANRSYVASYFSKLPRIAATPVDDALGKLKG